MRGCAYGTGRLQHGQRRGRGYRTRRRKTAGSGRTESLTRPLRLADTGGSAPVSAQPVAVFQEAKMNWDRIEGNWKQFKGRVKEEWGKLTDDELDVIAGKRDKVAGKIQERYGLS